MQAVCFLIINLLMATKTFLDRIFGDVNTRIFVHVFHFESSDGSHIGAVTVGNLKYEAWDAI
jgi:hypothetical protein